MVELQRHTGMRPGEVTSMTTGQIDRTGETWVYLPRSHKTEHHDRARPIYLGPQAQAVLAPLLRPDEPTEFIFSPRRAILESRERHRKNPPRKRRSPDQKKSTRRVNSCYARGAYCRAIVRGIEEANEHRAANGLPPIERWHPHQIRHTVATKLERELGIDVARTVLGHTTPTMTAIYVQADQEKAKRAMSTMG